MAQARRTDSVLRRAVCSLALVAALCFPALAQAPADIRIALVIGNAAYAGSAPQAVDVSSVIDALKAAGYRMNILVLDACRDNPCTGTASPAGLP